MDKIKALLTRLFIVAFLASWEPLSAMEADKLKYEHEQQEKAVLMIEQREQKLEKREFIEKIVLLLEVGVVVAELVVLLMLRRSFLDFEQISNDQKNQEGAHL